MSSMLRPLLVLFALLTVLTGLVYPLAVTGIGKAVFPNQVSGSLVMRDGKAVGSSLIGQSFQEPKYFWGRISATSPMPNNATASGGSNLGPTNPALIEAVRGRIDALKAADPDNSLPIPVDADKVRQLVMVHVETPQWGIFGEARVNVLLHNLELDRAQ